LRDELLEGKGNAKIFDAVLVDEVQDFEPNWFSCLLSAMKAPENGDLLIVADAEQGLYHCSRISWKDLGIKATGRSHSQRFDLDRNSTETLTLAESSQRGLICRREARKMTHSDP